jgi:hypothetical protein
MNEYHIWLANQTEADCGDPIEADCPDEAAEIWAEEVDRQAGFEIAKQKDKPVVCVKDLETGDILKYEVLGELIPIYDAMRIE